MLKEAGNSVLYYGRIIFASLSDLLRGRESINDLSGPVGIVTAIGQAASYGWQDLLEMLALITVNVGIFNLLPFPALDGGKVVFLLIEGVTGHAVPEKIQSGLIVAAFTLLFGLMILQLTMISSGSLPGQCDTERKTTMRQLKREVKIGNVTIGGNNPIAVQTMLNVPVEDIEGNVAQAKRCEAAGCQILRVTCPSAADAKCIEAVKNAVNIPIVADIHFDYKAALACADVGVDKIRINPGNIGDDDRVKAVVDACQRKNIPIRIGVNGGSLEKHILAKYGAPTPEAMVESALYHVRLLENSISTTSSFPSRTPMCPA